MTCLSGLKGRGGGRRGQARAPLGGEEGGGVGRTGGRVSPAPFGPMMAVNFRKGPMDWVPAYDLKF